VTTFNKVYDDHHKDSVRIKNICYTLYVESKAMNESPAIVTVCLYA